MDNLFGKDDLFSLLQDLKNVDISQDNAITIEQQIYFDPMKMPENTKLFYFYLEGFKLLLRNEIERRLRPNIQEFETRLKGYLTDSLGVLDWSVDNFFALCVGFHFIHDLKADKYSQGQDAYDSRRTILYLRPFELLDVIKVQAEIECCYLEQLLMLVQEAKQNGISAHAAPIKWLEIAERLILYVSKNENGNSLGMRNLVVPEFSKSIRC